MSTDTFLGIDFLRSADGEWCILEANHCPAGIAECDRLATVAQKYGSPAFGTGAAINTLASALLPCQLALSAALVLPRNYEVDPHGFPATAIRVATGSALYSEPLVLADYNALAAALRALGTDAVVTDNRGVTKKNGVAALLDGRPVGGIYGAHALPARIPLPERSINVPSVAELCRDKLRLERLPFPRNAAVLPLPSATNPNAIATAGAAEWIIRKLRFGSRSTGIRRVRASEVSSVSRSARARHIWQPWVAPSSADLGRGPIYFDVRLFVLNGEVLGGVARCACAPMAGIAEDSELAWLTTLGPRLPLVAGDVPRTEAIGLTRSDISLLVSASREVATLIAEHAGRAGSASTGRVRGPRPRVRVRVTPRDSAVGLTPGGMNHLAITVTNLERSGPFYDQVLGYLGYERWSVPERVANSVRRRKILSWRGRYGSINLREAKGDGALKAFDRNSPGMNHFAFNAVSRTQVDGCHALLLELEAAIVKPPADYDYLEGFYSVYFLDPDGIMFELAYTPLV